MVFFRSALLALALTSAVLGQIANPATTQAMNPMLGGASMMPGMQGMMNPMMPYGMNPMSMMPYGPQASMLGNPLMSGMMPGYGMSGFPSMMGLGGMGMPGYGMSPMSPFMGMPGMNPLLSGMGGMSPYGATGYPSMQGIQSGGMLGTPYGRK